MSEPPNSQRSATRAPVDRPIRLQFDDSLEVDEGHCINISIGGLYVHTTEPRPAGTLVRFELELEDEQSIRGLGEVAWQQRADAQGKGVGIKFRFLEQRDRQMIFKLVSQHIKARLERENDGVMASRDAEPQAPEAAAFSAAHVERLEAEAASPEGGIAAPHVASVAPGDGREATTTPSLGEGRVSPDGSLGPDQMDETIPMAVPVHPPAPSAAASESEGASAVTTTPAPQAAAPVVPEVQQSSLFDRWDPPSTEPAPTSPAPTPATRSTDPAVGSDSASKHATETATAQGAAQQASIFAQGSLAPPASAADDASASLADQGLFDHEPIGQGLAHAPVGAGASEHDAISSPPELAGAAQAGGRTAMRRSRSSSGLSAAMWALLLALGVALVGAYLLRDRLFSGIVGDSTAGTPPAVGADAEPEAEPDVDPPSITGPGARSTAAVTEASSSSPAATAGQSGPQTTLAEDIADPVAPTSAERRPAAPIPQPEAPKPAPETPAPIPSASAPPAVAREGVAPARDGHAMRRLIDISWRPSADSLVVTLVADGTIAPPRVKRFRLGGPTPREVVVLTGMSQPFGRNLMPVAEGGVASIRTGFHTKRQGNEVHVVMDLSDPSRQLVDIRHLGKRIELVLGLPNG